MHPFRTAVEARDLDAVLAVLADDVVFHSPIVFKPYRGKAATGAVLAAAFEVFVTVSPHRTGDAAAAADGTTVTLLS